MEKITLYQLKTPDLTVIIEAYFENEKLVIEGYDIGKKVSDWFGDSDYEYSVTIRPEEVRKIYTLIQVKEGNKEELLRAIADKYNTSFCYSEFRNFRDENGIKYESFSWT